MSFSIINYQKWVSQFRVTAILVAILLFSELSYSQNHLNNAGLPATATASGAFSLRRLSNSYAGNAIQVRRSSDNTTQNIGFLTSGILDTVSLKTFVSTGSAFVSIWYDQSGNGRNAVQATAARQPRIMNAGVIDYNQGRPTLVFSGVQDMQTSMTAVQATTSGNITTANGIFSGTQVNSSVFGNGTPGTNRYNLHAPWGDGITYFDIGDANIPGGRITGATSWTNLSIGTFQRNGANASFFRNGTQINSSTTMSTTVTSTNNIWIGSMDGTTHYLIGNVSELLFFPSALNTTDRQSLENNQLNYITDFTAPVINCPSNVSANVSAGTCTSSQVTPNPTFSDNLGVTRVTWAMTGANVASNNGTGFNYVGTYLFNRGTTTITYTAYDASGNTSMCNYTVTINDNIAPVLTCPANITVSAPAGTCVATVNYNTILANDNCSSCTSATPITGYTVLGVYDGYAYYISSTAFTAVNAFAAAATAGGQVATINSAAENSWVRSAANAAGFTGTYYIGQNDVTTEGTFVGGSGETVSYFNWNAGEPNNSGNEDYTQVFNNGLWNDIGGGGASNFILKRSCLTITRTAGLASGSSFPVGVTTVTHASTDASGNTGTCSFTVTVNDVTPPTVTCPANQSINLDASCAAIVPDYRSLATISDNCTALINMTIVQSPLPGSTINGNGSQTITITATDASNNSTFCSFTLTKVDVTPPVMNCPANISVNATPGQCGAIVNYTVNVTDNCSASACGPSSIPGFTSLGSWNGHTYFRSTGSANWTTANANAIALGGHLVTVTSAGENAFLSTAGACYTAFSDQSLEGTWVWVNGEAVTYTNWAGGEPNNSGGSENYMTINWNGASQWNDVNGNNAYPYIVEFDCLTINTTAGLASGSLFPIGTTTVTTTATDAGGNISNCSFTVTVVDNIAPTVIVPANMTVSAPVGQCSATVNYNVSATDNCSACTSAPAITGFTTLGVYNGVAYYLSNNTFTWPNAFADANSQSGQLATIFSAAENSWVRTAANTAGFTGTYWLGINDVQTEGVFLGAYGEAPGYFNWSSGEPNGGTGENYVQVYNSGLWNDLSGANSMRYILKKTCITPTLTVGLASGSVFPLGTSVVSYAATDAYGNVGTASFNITVVINPASYTKAVTASPATICQGGSTTISIANSDVGVTYQLRNNANNANVGTTYPGTGGTINIPLTNLTSTTTYNVLGTVASSCTFQLNNTVTVTVNPAPAAPGVSNNSRCGTGTVALSATPPSGSTIDWYSALTAGTLLLSGNNNYTTPSISATTIYYVVSRNNATGCTTLIRTPVTATVNTNATITLSSGAGTNNQTTCAGVLITPITYALTGTVVSVNTTGLPSGVTGSLSGSVYTISGTPASGGNFSYTVTVTGTCSNPTATGSFTLTAPTVAGTIANVNICSGGSGSLSVTGNTGSVLRWERSTDLGGTWTNIANTTTSLSFGATTTTTLYRALVRNTTCGAQLYTNNARVGIHNLWIGVVSNDWTNTANWSIGALPSNVCPDIIIPQLTTPNVYPLVNTNVSMNNLVIQPNASMVVNNVTVQVAGSITNNGILNFSNGTLELNGSSAQTIAGSIFQNGLIKNLTLSNPGGVSLSGVNDTLKITGVVGFGSNNCVLTTNGNLTLVSDAYGTAAVADLTNNGANSGNNILGNVNVERYIPQHPKAWQFLAVPTNGGTIRQTWQEGNATLASNTSPGRGIILTSNISGAVGLGFDIFTPTGGPSMKSYNSTTGLWDGVANTSMQIANPKGYMVFVRGDRSVFTSSAPATAVTLRTRGQLYTIGANAPAAVTVPAGKFESIGNPYAAAIDFRNITKSASPNVADLFYVWDPLLTNNYYGLGGYQTISGANGWRPIPGGTANYNAAVANPFIQSGQAFLVRSLGAAGSVSFTESAKVTTSQNVFRETVVNNEKQFFRAYLHNANNILSDGNVVTFDGEYSNEFDATDAEKLMNGSENFGIRRFGITLSLEARNVVQHSDTIFYNLSNLRSGNYSLKFDPENMQSAPVTAILVDKHLNITRTLPLNDSSVISFNINAVEPGSYAADRFYVIFNAVRLLPVTFTNVQANRNTDKSIAVQWNTETEINLSHYEVERSADGRRFTSVYSNTHPLNNGATASYSFTDDQAGTGEVFYRIKAVNLNNTYQYSRIVKVAAVIEDKSVTVYPNPVENKMLQLHFEGMMKGNYQVQLINAAGQIMQTNSLKIGSQTTENISLHKNIAAGNYQLKITSANGEVKNISVLIN